MIKHLYPQDYAQIRNFRKIGVLRDVEEQELDLENGLVMVTCADGDRFFDAFNYKAKLLKTSEIVNKPRIHVLTRNGGALRLINNICPEYGDNLTLAINEPGSTMANDLLFEIKESLSLKRMKQVALYIHMPCGKATSHNIFPAQALHGLALANRRIIFHIPKIKVTTYCHVDYCQFESGKEKTYFVDLDKLTL